MLKSYLKVSLRNLQRHKGFSIINILGLAIGMACCILILQYVWDEQSYEQNHARADQIYRLVTEAEIGGRLINTALSPPSWGPTLVQDYPEVLQMVRIKTPNSRWLIKHEEKEFWEKGFYFVDESIFEVFSFTFVQGDPRTALSEPNTVVITESVASRYFGDEDPIGKVFDGEGFIFPRVTGVIKDFVGNTHFHGDFFTSMRTLVPTEDVNLYGDLYNVDFQSQGLNFAVYTYLLLQKGVPSSVLEAKIPGFVETYLGQQLRRRGGEIRPYLQPVADIHLHSNLDGEIESNSDISYVYIFSALALIIILIACINFMNLATARSASRAREVGMRKVVGASRSDIVKQFIGDAMLLAMISLALALVMVHLSLPVFNTVSGKQMVMDYGSGILPLSLVGITLAVGIVAGSYPAFFLSSFIPISVLKGSLRAGSTNVRMRKGLVILQFSMAIVMMVSTYVVFDQLTFLRERDLGFEKEHIINIPLANIDMANGYTDYKTAILQHPDILSATGSSALPGGLLGIVNLRPIARDDETGVTLNTVRADIDFIETLGIEMIAGRAFSLDFPSDAENGVVLNETAVRAFGWDDPIGQELVIVGRNTDQTLRVIGVTNDFHFRSLHRKIEPLVLVLSEPQSLWFGSIRVSGRNLSGTLDFLSTTWSEVFPEFPYEYSFLDEDFDLQYVAEQRLQSIFGAFSLFSIFITCLGLFALASFTAEQRTKEISIRKVMGASVSGLALMLARDFTWLVLIAFGPAAILAYLAMHRWLQSFAYHIDLGIAPFLMAGIAALVITVLSVNYQSIKAALANPVDSLKYE